MQTPYTIFQRSPLSCALVPVESPGFSLPAWQCISATVSIDAESLRGMQTPPAAASLSHKPDPFPSVVASFPPCRSLWPSRVKSSRVLALYQAFNFSVVQMQGSTGYGRNSLCLAINLQVKWRVALCAPPPLWGSLLDWLLKNTGISFWTFSPRHTFSHSISS